MSEAGQENGALVYGTVVAIGDWAVLLRGPSGSGKSDLALRLIEAGGVLVADDQVQMTREGPLVWTRAPKSLRGLLEVRGVGLVPMPVREKAPLALVIDLVAREDVPRLPDAETVDLLGVGLPRLRLWPFEASAPEKTRVALRSLLG